MYSEHARRKELMSCYFSMRRLTIFAKLNSAGNKLRQQSVSNVNVLKMKILILQ